MGNNNEMTENTTDLNMKRAGTIGEETWNMKMKRRKKWKWKREPTHKEMKRSPKIGDKVVFLDQAHYTLVKTNFFNGINHPEIVLWNSDNNDFKIIKSFDFKDFETRN